MVVRNANQEIMEPAGLLFVGNSSSVGRGGIERVMRIVPGLSPSPD